MPPRLGKYKLDAQPGHIGDYNHREDLQEPIKENLPETSFRQLPDSPEMLVSCML